MRKIYLSIAAFLVTALVVSQFFPPKKNTGGIQADHLFKQEQVPEEVSTILKKACLDCHSNQTTYLWYHQVAPVSWFITHHINEAKEELNLSDWGQMDILDKIGALEDISKEIGKGKMPLKSYQLMHPKARLSEREKTILIDWTESFSDQLLMTGE